MHKSKALLFLVILVITALVLGSGYYFAKRKSEPTYESKIDKVMFDKKNRSPKYVMTLPDYKDIHATSTTKPEEISEEGGNRQGLVLLEATDLLEKIPLAIKLVKDDKQIPMPQIDTNRDLIYKTDDFVLPKVADDGRKPWSAYGRQADVQPNFYKIGIIIDGLGLDTMLSKTAIDALPSGVSVSFSPYAQDLEKNIKEARRNGHETYIDLLLSSRDFLKSDTGPLAMSLTSNMDDNIRRLKKSLNVNAPIGGMIIQKGIFDNDNPTRLQMVLTEITNMGLLAIDATGEEYLDLVKTENLPRRKADIVIDNAFTREEIDKRLERAEEIARLNGSVLIAADPKPVVLHALSEWIKSFSPQPLNYEEAKAAVIDRPFAVVPISNLVSE